MDPRVEDAYFHKVEALTKRLEELFKVKPPFKVAVSYFDCPEIGGFRISAIDIHSGVSGTSFQRCDFSAKVLALILAAEDVVRMHDVLPWRPTGWSEDMDDRADADSKLQYAVSRILG